MISFYKQKTELNSSTSIEISYCINAKKTFKLSYSYSNCNNIVPIDENYWLSKIVFADIYNRFYNLVELNLSKFDHTYTFDLDIIGFSFNDATIYYFSDGIVHSYEFLMKENNETIGYINGKRLSESEWLKHPEKVRYDRTNKLKLLNIN